MGHAAMENAHRYYGEVLSESDDLGTGACATLEAPPPRGRRALINVHEDVRTRYNGCGPVAPQALADASILDLGCGAGQDAYVLAQLAGSSARTPTSGVRVPTLGPKGASA